MKAKLASKLSSSAVLILVTASLTGCQTGPKIDGNARDSAQKQTPSGPSFNKVAAVNQQSGSPTTQMTGRKQPVIDETIPQPAQAVPAATPQPAFDESKVTAQQAAKPTGPVIDETLPQPAPPAQPAPAATPQTALDENKATVLPAVKKTEPVIDESIPQPVQPAPVAGTQPAFNNSTVTSTPSSGRKEPTLKEIIPTATTEKPAAGPKFNDANDVKTADNQTGSRRTVVIDWNSRVGTYTYAQAVAEFGRPNRQAGLSDGKIIYKWFIQPMAAPRVNSGMSYYGKTGFGAGQIISPRYNDHVLQLTFGTNGVLTSWSKNY